MEDISIQIGQRLFNYRVSAVFRCGDKILLHHGLDKDHYTLPGGRVKEGESTVTALKREMKEEMGLDIEYVRPFSFIENFFEMDGKLYHELLVTHELKFKDEAVYFKEKIMPIEPEKQGKLEFLWFDINKLDNIDFVPIKLKEGIKRNSKDFLHFINFEK